MKKNILFIISIMLGIAAMFGVSGCSEDYEPVEELCGDSVGAYFITDESYERYVRNCAAEIGADEQWISDVLNGGNGGEWHYMIRSKSWFWCAIADNQITVAEIYKTVYDISVVENEYIGSSITKTISFCFVGDILCLNDNGEITEYKKDASYQRTQTRATTLSAPKNITADSGEKGYDFVGFHWDYQSGYGTVGAAVEIKKAGSDEYKTFEKIERVYMNMFVIQLEKSQFEVGENLVRIYHIGGPSITNDKFIIVNKNSAYVTYRVIVNNDGSVKVK